jgi:hypothetical protein
LIAGNSTESACVRYEVASAARGSQSSTAAWQAVSLVTIAATSQPADQCFAEGTSWQEIGPDFFQPSRRSHVRGWYTTSGS